MLVLIDGICLYNTAVFCVCLHFPTFIYVSMDSARNVYRFIAVVSGRDSCQNVFTAAYYLRDVLDTV
jgi:hypothetical protein